MYIYVHIPKLIKLYTLNICSLLHVHFRSVGLLKIQIALPKQNCLQPPSPTCNFP